MTGAGSIVLHNITTVSNLDVTGSGAISQTGSTALAIAGTTTIDAGGNVVGTNDVTLLETGNDFGTIAVIGGDVDLLDTNSIDLGTITAGGTLDVTATMSNITDSGDVNASGAASFTAANGASILLDTSTNTFGSTVTFIAATGNLND